MADLITWPRDKKFKEAGCLGVRQHRRWTRGSFACPFYSRPQVDPTADDGVLRGDEKGPEESQDTCILAHVSRRSHRRQFLAIISRPVAVIIC